MKFPLDGFVFFVLFFEPFLFGDRTYFGTGDTKIIASTGLALLRVMLRSWNDYEHIAIPMIQAWAVVAVGDETIAPPLDTAVGMVLEELGYLREFVDGPVDAQVFIHFLVAAIEFGIRPVVWTIFLPQVVHAGIAIGVTATIEPLSPL